MGRRCHHRIDAAPVLTVLVRLEAQPVGLDNRKLEDVQAVAADGRHHNAVIWDGDDENVRVVPGIGGCPDSDLRRILLLTLELGRDHTGPIAGDLAQVMNADHALRSLERSILCTALQTIGLDHPPLILLAGLLPGRGMLKFLRDQIFVYVKDRHVRINPFESNMKISCFPILIVSVALRPCRNYTK